VNPCKLGQLIVGVTVEIGALAGEGVAEKNLGGQLRGGNTRLFKEPAPLL
jgi:hypothetical protein